MRNAAIDRLSAAFGRFALISIGMVSVCWGIITFPVFWREAGLEQTADRILDGDQFKREILQNLLADADPVEPTWVRPETLSSAAVIRLRLAEQASLAEGSKPIGAIFDEFGVARSIRRSLSVAPADPFLWLALFQVKRMTGDRSKEDLAYLVGPREGWVAVKRNSIALGIFPELPRDLAEMAVTEFKDPCRFWLL